MVMQRIEKTQKREIKTNDIRGYRWDYLDLTTRENGGERAEIIGVYAGFGDVDYPELRGPVVGFLDILGQRGWELVSCIALPDNKYRYLFKILVEEA